MKVGIISPRVLIRRALITLLASLGGALVVMEGNNLSDSLEEVRGSDADMLIVDLCGQGLQALPNVSALSLVPKVVVLMDEVNNESYARAFQLGIWGCLSTKHSPIMFQSAIDSVARGERWMPRTGDNNFAEKESLIEKAAEGLTPREREVLGLLANGFRNKEIAARLNISEETAKSHIKSIYRKLKIKGRRDAMLRYYEHARRPVNRAMTNDERLANGPFSVNSHET